MKFNFLSLFFALGLISVLSTSSLRDPNNPPTGKTGAPGETTCMQSGCHSGGSFVGTVTISGVPDTAIFGHVYPITLTNTSNCVRAGFQLTCLDSLNVKCGTLTSATGVNIGTGTGRQYARQSAPRNLSNGSTSWTFNWTAPNSAAGNKAKFYFVSLCSNNNGQKTGDNVLVENKEVHLTATVPSVEPSNSLSVNLYPTQLIDVLHVDMEGMDTGHLYIFDANGRLAHEQPLKEFNAINLSHLPNGSYLAKIQASNGFATKKFVKP